MRRWIFQHPKLPSFAKLNVNMNNVSERATTCLMVLFWFPLQTASEWVTVYIRYIRVGPRKQSLPPQSRQTRHFSRPQLPELPSSGRKRHMGLVGRSQGHFLSPRESPRRQGSGWMANGGKRAHFPHAMASTDDLAETTSHFVFCRLDIFCRVQIWTNGFPWRT